MRRHLLRGAQPVPDLRERQVAQSWPTLGDPMDCSPPGSSVLGILQELWSGLPCPPPGDLPHPGIEPLSVVSPALAEGKPVPNLNPAKSFTFLCDRALYVFLSTCMTPQYTNTLFHPHTYVLVPRKLHILESCIHLSCDSAHPCDYTNPS